MNLSNTGSTQRCILSAVHGHINGRILSRLFSLNQTPLLLSHTALFIATMPSWGKRLRAVIHFTDSRSDALRLISSTLRPDNMPISGGSRDRAFPDNDSSVRWGMKVRRPSSRSVRVLPKLKEKLHRLRIPSRCCLGSNNKRSSCKFMHLNFVHVCCSRAVDM